MPVVSDKTPRPPHKLWVEFLLRGTLYGHCLYIIVTLHCYTLLLNFIVTLYCYTYCYTLLLHFIVTLHCYTLLLHFIVTLYCYTSLLHYCYTYCYTSMLHFIVTLYCYTLLLNLNVTLHSDAHPCDDLSFGFTVRQPTISSSLCVRVAGSHDSIRLFPTTHWQLGTTKWITWSEHQTCQQARSYTALYVRLWLHSHTAINHRLYPGTIRASLKYLSFICCMGTTEIVIV